MPELTDLSATLRAVRHGGHRRSRERRTGRLLRAAGDRCARGRGAGDDARRRCRRNRPGVASCSTRSPPRASTAPASSPASSCSPTARWQFGWRPPGASRCFGRADAVVHVRATWTPGRGKNPAWATFGYPGPSRPRTRPDAQAESGPIVPDGDTVVKEPTRSSSGLQHRRSGHRRQAGRGRPGVVVGSRWAATDTRPDFTRLEAIGVAEPLLAWRPQRRPPI